MRDLDSQPDAIPVKGTPAPFTQLWNEQVRNNPEEIQLITARIRRMTGGYVFSLSTIAGVPGSVSRWGDGGGLPQLGPGSDGGNQPDPDGGLPQPGPDGGYPGQGWGTPYPDLDLGGTLARSGWVWGYPGQVRAGAGTLARSRWGVPQPGME